MRPKKSRFKNFGSRLRARASIDHGVPAPPDKDHTGGSLRHRRRFPLVNQFAARLPTTEPKVSSPVRPASPRLLPVKDTFGQENECLPT